MNFFLVPRIFFYMKFDFKNGCKNEFKDNNEKSCSWSRNRVSCKIDFKVQWLRNSDADNAGVKLKRAIHFSISKHVICSWQGFVFNGLFYAFSFRSSKIWKSPILYFIENLENRSNFRFKPMTLGIILLFFG